MAEVAEMCRITVVGPDRRVDLAVPATMALAELMPQLVRFVVRDDAIDEPEATGWLVQRLGEAPFGPAATAQSADWLDGEILHLRRIEQPLPELDFDDVADAVATSVDRQGDRWSPVAQRRLFSALTVVGIVVTATALGRLPAGIDLAATVLLALVLAAWTVRTARSGADGATLRWAELLVCLVGALAGARAAALLPPPSGSLPVGAAVLAAVGGAVLAGLLLAARSTPLAPTLPLVPPLVTVMAAAGVAALAILRLLTGLDARQAIALLVVLLVVLVLLAPRLAIGAAGIRVPQLPRSAKEMTIDVEPIPADEIAERTARADQVLSSVVLAAAILLAPSIWVLTMLPGWPPMLLAAVLTLLVAMRSREFLAVQQRLALVVAALIGTAAVLDDLMTTGGPVADALIALSALAATAAAAAAARRQAGRRMRPRWRQAVLVLEGVLAATCLPLLMQVLGVFAWARGLAG